MDPESKRLLEETYKLAAENNQILKKLRHTQMISSIMRVLYWLLIIGVSAGAFYFLQPYLVGVQEFMKSAGTSFDNFKNFIPEGNTPR